MPLLHVYVPEGLVDASAKRELGEKMTSTLLEVEKIPDNPAARASSWVFWHDMPDGTWTVPGLPPETPRCLVEVVAPEGLLDREQKAAAVARLTEDLASKVPSLSPMEARLRVWVLIRDVPDGSWGVAGFLAPTTIIRAGLSGGQ